MKTRYSTFAAAFLAWSLLAAKTASAVTLVFALSGNLTGTLGNTNLNGNTFQFTLTRDTSNGQFSSATTTSLSISGVGAGSFSDVMNFSCSGGTGSFIQDIGFPFTVVAFSGSGLSGWNCVSPLAPVSVTQSNPSDWKETRTTLGNLTVTGMSNLSFTTTTPDGLSISTSPTLPPGAAGTFYSQTLKAAGGSPPYAWALVSGALPPGLSFSSAGTITGTPTSSGTLSFTLQVTDSASTTVSQAFSLAIGNSLTFSSAFRIPHLLDGAGWTTRISIVNIDQVPVTYTFHFWGDNGAAMPFPIVNQAPGVLSGTLAPGASFFAQSPGTSSTLMQGWAEIATSGQIGLTSIFQFSIGSSRDSQGSSIASFSGSSFLMPFDNTQGNVTAVAIANTNAAQPLTVTMNYVTDGGAQTTTSIVLAPHAHQAFVTTTNNPAVSGFRGAIHFSAPTADIAVMGLEFTAAGAFTSLGAFQ
ncbi:MAG: Ig domain-containing protein [Acidobacteriota bacterium]|nr:Ig domain-containing protein [Acidobacteriota bacterium]